MRNGFTFKDRHSSEFGVTVKTKSRPVRPQVKEYASDVPYRDGEYDFSSANPQGREHYRNRIFTVSIAVSAANLAELQKKIGAVSLWLGGSGSLIFDDIPLSVWSAKIIDEIIYMPERGGKNAVIDVSFKAGPFAESVFGIEGPALKDAVELDSALPLDIGEKYVYTLQGSASLYVMNFGDRPARPVVKIVGNAGTVTMAMDGKTLSFAAGGSATVDFDKQMVTKNGGAIKTAGEFFEFPEGMQILNMTNSNSNTLTVTVYMKPEYMYIPDYTSLDWSGANA